MLSSVLTMYSAGTTDSALTTHGVLQASRLGAHLALAGVQIFHIFSSDLQRAFKTADAIRLAQPNTLKTVTQLHLLREQDFGFYEGKHFYDRPRGSDKSGREVHREAHMNTEGFRDVESKRSMNARVEAFLDGYLVSLLGKVGDEETVAVVAHGIILTYLWRGILARFEPGTVAIASGVVAGDNGMGLEYLGGWSNTGYLDLEVKSKVLPLSSLPATSMESSNPIDHVEAVDSGITSLPAAKLHPKPNPLPATDADNFSIKQSRVVPVVPIAQQAPDPTLPDGSVPLPQIQPAPPGSSISVAAPAVPPRLLNMSLVVKAVNSQEHLKGLKKTRGGIGSSKHDEKQKTMDAFFKRQKLG